MSNVLSDGWNGAADFVVAGRQWWGGAEFSSGRRRGESKAEASAIRGARCRKGAG